MARHKRFTNPKVAEPVIPVVPAQPIKVIDSVSSNVIITQTMIGTWENKGLGVRRYFNGQRYILDSIETNHGAGLVTEFWKKG